MASGSRAVISDDGLYRYVLVRRWAYELPAVTFVMLNPSTADAFVDDPTIRRCVGFAKAWGCGALRVVNLFGYRTPYPDTLRSVADPVGPENDGWLCRYAIGAQENSTPLIAAWGAVAYDTDLGCQRVQEVLALPGMDALQSLGITAKGYPRHPLYVRADTLLQTWPQERGA